MCALVTGVQTCALPIWLPRRRQRADGVRGAGRPAAGRRRVSWRHAACATPETPACVPGFCFAIVTRRGGRPPHPIRSTKATVRDPESFPLVLPQPVSGRFRRVRGAGGLRDLLAVPVEPAAMPAVHLPAHRLRRARADRKSTRL